MTGGRLAGTLTAGVTGVLMAAISAYGGGLAASLLAIFVLTALLVGAGVLYGGWVENGRLQAGIGAGVLYWTAAFPLVRLLHTVMMGESTRAGLEQGLIPFLVFQAMVGGAFGLGFVLLFNQFSTLITTLGAKKKGFPKES